MVTQWSRGREPAVGYIADRHDRKEKKMRRAVLALGGVASLTLAGCGAETGQAVPDEAPQDVGVAVSKLTNCTRTELVNFDVSCGPCGFRLMMNNFSCAEGIVGQASTETLSGTAGTATVVATQLFGQNHEGSNWGGPVSIATQWGHAWASVHSMSCGEGTRVSSWANWKMDPWSKRPVLDPANSYCR
jgi:hypothetical protein